MLIRRDVVASLTLIAAAGAATAQERMHEAILTALEDRIGPQNALVTILEQPFTTVDGRVGFTGQDGFLNRFVWYDDAPVFFTGLDAPPGISLTGSDSVMGVGAGGAWVIGTNINLEKGIWSDRGQVAIAGHPEPSLEPTTFDAIQRITMTDDGTVYFMADLSTNGGDRESRGLIRVTDYGTDAAEFDVLYRAGVSVDPIGGGPSLTIGSNSSNPALRSTGGVSASGYDVSENNRYVIGIADVQGDGIGTTNDTSIVLFDNVAGTNTLLAREGESTGSGDNWDNWSAAAVNNAGNWIAYGDTDGATSSDAFLAYNGEVALREGAVIDDLALTTVHQAGINNMSDVVSIWGLADGGEGVFWSRGADFGLSELILQTGDDVDIDGDGISDGIVGDIVTDSGLALDLSDTDTLYLKIKFDDLSGFEPLDAIIAVTVPTPSTGVLLAAGSLVAVRRRRR